MKYASFFAGVGGLDLGFEKAGFQGVYANEVDKYPAETLRANYPEVSIEVKDIKDVDIKNLPDFDVLLAGFPCQAFSIAGYRKGFEDERGELFFDVLKIIKFKQPRFVLLENVKNLVGHDNGKTFRVIIEALEKNGYKVKSQVMNASKYGNVPQNRERIYIVAFKNDLDYKAFKFPEKIPLKSSIKEYIDFDELVEERYYYNEQRCNFFAELKEAIVSSEHIYQWRRKYVRENKSNVCPTLTANMGTGGHNVPLILSKSGIRKLTPRECFRLQGFPEDFKLPNQANGRLYTQAGNSVVVTVVERIAEQIIKSTIRKKQNQK